MKTLYVAFTHGNEPPPYALPHGRLVANVAAFQMNERYKETDLNRSYNVTNPNSYEERRAVEILDYIQREQYDLVIDVHRTDAPKAVFTAIISKLEDYQYAVQYLPHAVVLADIPHSLIANVPHGVGLEYPRHFTGCQETPSLYEAFAFVDAQDGWEDFVPVEEGIPYLVGETAYAGKCFLLRKL
jgi:hypothetical protein